MNYSWTKYLPDIVQEWLQGRQHLQKALSNTSWLLFDSIVRIAIGLTIGAWVARYLGPAQFGELAYVISFIAFFQVFADLQADGFIVRDIAQEKDDPSVILGTALWLRLLFGTGAWLLSIACMAIFHPADHRLTLITAVVGASMVFRASDTVDLWFQSQSQSRRTVLAKFIAYLVSNGTKVLLVIWKAPLVAFAGAISLEAATLAFVLAIVYRRFPVRNRWKARASQVKALLHQCWPFIASGFMMTIFSRIDQIMLKEILGERELGIYAAALPISMAWAIVPSKLVISLAPYVAQKMSQDVELYQEALVKIFRFFAIAAVLVTSVTALASPFIIRVLYGSQYQYSSVVLSTHVFVNLFLFQGTAQYLWVINNNVRAVTLFGTFLSAVLCALSNNILIRKFGILGAAYATLIAECASVVVIPCLFRRDLRYLYKRAFLFTGSAK